MCVVLPFFRKVLLDGGEMSRNTYFSPLEIALTSVMCALWAILNFTLGPLSFRLLGLPIIHDFAAFFTLLLATWATGKPGTASLVGIIGTVIVLSVGGPLPNVGFAASAVLFDAMMSITHHKIYGKALNMIAATLTTIVSAYFAGVLIGIFLMSKQLDLATLYFAATIWGGWHMAGGVVSVAITLPIIGILEKANVGKIRGDKEKGN
jgi:hypothetical protein